MQNKITLSLVTKQNKHF